MHNLNMSLYTLWIGIIIIKHQNAQHIVSDDIRFSKYFMESLQTMETTTTL